MHEFARHYKSTLSDVDLAGIWERFRASGRDRPTLYTLPPMNGTDFAAWARKPDVHLWVITFRGEAAGIFWITDREGATGHCHFGTLPVGVRRTKDNVPVPLAFGRFCLATALYEQRQGPDGAGHYLLDRLLGITPFSNEAAIRFTARLRAQHLAVIPGGTWLHDSQQNVDALLTLYSRDLFPEAWCTL